MLTIPVSALKNLRDLLLALHSQLLQAQKGEFEKTNGQIQGPGHFFKLVTENEEFQWLRSLSALVVAIDELMESKETPEESKVSSIVLFTSSIIGNRNEQDSFSNKYYSFLETHPDLLHQHTLVKKELGLLGT